MGKSFLQLWGLGDISVGNDATPDIKLGYIRFSHLG